MDGRGRVSMHREVQATVLIRNLAGLGLWTFDEADSADVMFPRVPVCSCSDCILTLIGGGEGVGVVGGLS
jgi:hypothetical protein